MNRNDTDAQAATLARLRDAVEALKSREAEERLRADRAGQGRDAANALADQVRAARRALWAEQALAGT